MKFEALESKTVVLPIDNIDTDQIKIGRAHV